MGMTLSLPDSRERHERQVLREERMLKLWRDHKKREQKKERAAKKREKELS